MTVFEGVIIYPVRLADDDVGFADLDVVLADSDFGIAAVVVVQSGSRCERGDDDAVALDAVIVAVLIHEVV